MTSRIRGYVGSLIFCFGMALIRAFQIIGIFWDCGCGFIQSLFRKSNEKEVRNIVRRYYDPASGKPQFGWVEALDLSVVVPGQKITLIFGDNDIECFPDILLEVLSSSKGDTLARFKILEFNLDRMIGTDKYLRSRITLPPFGHTCSIPEIGTEAVRDGQRVLIPYDGGQNFLRKEMSIMFELNGRDDEELIFISDTELSRIYISEP